MVQMKTKDSWHFIGIGGIGMSGLARVLLQREAAVSGSDLSDTPITRALKERGASVFCGHKAEQVPGKSTVVVSTDIKDDNPEYRAALQDKLPVIHRSDLLHELMKGHKGLAVAGTHGKTTTSSLLAWVLVEAGWDPSYVVGGWLPGLETNANGGKSDYFVVEADESDGTFIKYHPHGAIVTNVDFDHMNHFGSEKALLDAFKTFLKQVKSQKHHFWCGDDALLASLKPKGVSYGFAKDNALRIISHRQDGWRSWVDLEFEGKTYSDVEIAMPGRHNALNATAVFGLALSLGMEEDALRKGLQSFRGVKRRCEIKGDAGGVLVLDDYAHHPTELAATLSGIRRAIGERRLIAVFQPHRYSRTQHILGTFDGAFDAADELLVTDVFASREDPIEGVSGEAVVGEVKATSSVPVRHVSRNSLRSTLVTMARPSDVIVTLGAGDITKLSEELAEHFAEQPARRYHLGVLAGGISAEHDVSCMSTQQVLENIDRNKYEVELFGITRSGRWIHGPDALEKLRSFKQEQGAPKPARLPQPVLDKLLSCDVVLPVLHGTYGEDGTIQGFLEVLGKPYAGSDHRAAALCMDKVATKRMLADAEIRTVPYITFSQRQWSENAAGLKSEIEGLLGVEVYVKPRHLGSSIETHKVTTPEELEQAVRGVFRVDTHVLVEKCMYARELEFAIIGNDDPVVLPPGEIFSAGRTHTYEGKYSDSPTPDTPRADLPEDVATEGAALARRAFLTTRCSGMARVDFFFDKDGVWWLNEINPIPGFTKNSMFPKICVANDITLDNVIDRLMVLALARYRRSQRLEVSGSVGDT